MIFMTLPLVLISVWILTSLSLEEAGILRCVNPWEISNHVLQVKRINLWLTRVSNKLSNSLVLSVSSEGGISSKYRGPCGRRVIWILKKLYLLLTLLRLSVLHFQKTNFTPLVKQIKLEICDLLLKVTHGLLLLLYDYVLLQAFRTTTLVRAAACLFNHRATDKRSLLAIRMLTLRQLL